MNNYICPHCKSQLTKIDNVLKCKNRHHFDISKEGYCNLLPVNKKKSKLPGDNRGMMNARREFLNAGGYNKLADKLVKIISELLKDINNPEIFDLGCGEGYYTGYLQKRLSCSISALDISKVAIKYAAKRYKDVNFCVASAYEIPVEDNSVNLLTRIYAPSLDSELKRVIKHGGYLVTVTPGPRHLYQLREVIYKDVIEHPTENSVPSGFVKNNQYNLKYTLEIDNKKDILNLIEMTPFAWKFNDEKRDTILDNDKWFIECDFNIEIYTKE